MLFQNLTRRILQKENLGSSFFLSTYLIPQKIVMKASLKVYCFNSEIVDWWEKIRCNHFVATKPFLT